MYFSLIGNYLRPSNNSRALNLSINVVVFYSDNLLRFTKMVKCLPECIFTVLLKNKNIIFKSRRSKVTDYAALKFIKMK